MFPKTRTIGELREEVQSVAREAFPAFRYVAFFVRNVYLINGAVLYVRLRLLKGKRSVSQGSYAS